MIAGFWVCDCCDCGWGFGLLILGCVLRLVGGFSGRFDFWLGLEF